MTNKITAAKNTNGMKGYKAFHTDWTCRQKQYTCPGVFEEKGKLQICGHGMHFCKNLIDCFNYYSFYSDYHIAEVIAFGDVVEDKTICCTNKLEIVREVPRDEMLNLINAGKDNIGLDNDGDRNVGNCNSGHQNTGNNNVGERNSGDWNTGHHNTGTCNTGNHNAGNCNTGCGNTGNSNFGNYNTGDVNAGNHNVGQHNIGSSNTGHYNIGDHNVGDYNPGCDNTGNYNIGDYNTGTTNPGMWNAGNCNSGDRNTGNRNAGDYNTGDFNVSSYNVGCFNTIQNDKIMLFNKPSDWTHEDWVRSRACYILSLMPQITTAWVYTKDMTEKQKIEHPEYEMTDGFLRTIYPDVQGWWDNLLDKNKEEILSIPNFDKQIFFECTGINVTK